MRILKKLKFSIALSVVKSLGGTPTYLQIIAVFGGLFYWIKNRTVFLVLTPLLLMIGLNLISSIFYGNYPIVVARLFQLFSLIGLCHFFIVYFKKDRSFLRLLDLFLVLSILVFVFQILFSGPVKGRELFGFTRYALIIGEPNFSALLYLSVCLIYFYKKCFTRSLIALLLMVATLSRGTVVGLAVFLGFFLIEKIMSKFSNVNINSFPKKLSKFYFGILCLYPFLLIVIDKFLDSSLKMRLIMILTPRYYLHQVYAWMGIKNPFGVGYFNGMNYFNEYVLPIREAWLGALLPVMNHEIEHSQQHSIFLQAMSEFGIVGYGLFFILLWKLLLMSMRVNFTLTSVFLGFLTSLLFLNAFNEVAFYLILAFIIREYSSNSSDGKIASINVFQGKLKSRFEKCKD